MYFAAISLIIAFDGVIIIITVLPNFSVALESFKFNFCVHEGPFTTFNVCVTFNLLGFLLFRTSQNTCRFTKNNKIVETIPKKISSVMGHKL